MPAARISLPSHFNLQNVHTFVALLIANDGTPQHQSLEIDFQNLSFIDGCGLTVLCNTLEWLKKRSLPITFSNFDSKRRSIQYLDDCGFFKDYLGRSLRECASPRDTTLPVRKISHNDSFQWIEFTAVPWLAHKLLLPESALDTVRVCLKEIFNNIKDHSREDIGCIHTQWYPNNKTISITVSDFGVGIPVTIRQRHKTTNDGDAIQLATQEGISANSITQNRGAGLTQLVDYVTRGNGGSLKVLSNHGSLSCRANGLHTEKVPHSHSSYYPGTLIDVTLRSDTFPVEERTREDLEW